MVGYLTDLASLSGPLNLLSSWATQLIITAFAALQCAMYFVMKRPPQRFIMARDSSPEFTHFLRRWHSSFRWWLGGLLGLAAGAWLGGIGDALDIKPLMRGGAVIALGSVATVAMAVLRFMRTPQAGEYPDWLRVD
jgi:hypothetical protein